MTFVKNFLFALCTVLATASSVDLLANPAKAEKTIAETANQVSPILIGETIPDVTLFDANGFPVSLRKAASEKPTILVFYRGGWCPYCNAQLSQIQSIEKHISDLGYQILAISPDTPDMLKKTTKGRSLSYTLLSDFNLLATKNFGLGFYIPRSYAKKIKSAGGKAQSFEESSKKVLPVPALFILDKNGVIQFEYVNPNFKVRIDPQLLYTAAKLALKDG